jgi:hypothetical protein
MDRSLDYSYSQDQQFFPRAIERACQIQVEANQIFAASTRLKFLVDTHVQEVKVNAARKALDVIQDGEK